MSTKEPGRQEDEDTDLISPGDDSDIPEPTDLSEHLVITECVLVKAPIPPTAVNDGEHKTAEDQLDDNNDEETDQHYEINADETLDDVTNDDSGESNISVEAIPDDGKAIDICESPETRPTQSAPVTKQCEINSRSQIRSDESVNLKSIGVQVELVPPKDTQLIVIHGMKDPLSTLHGFLFRWEGHTFDSVEQAFVYQRAIENNKPEIAKEIRRARHAGQAKSIGNKMIGNLSKAWQQKAPTLMEAMLREKLKQSDQLRTRLLATENALLVFATAKPGVDYVWASGLDVENTSKSRGVFPGQNLVGKILTKMRAELHEAEKPCEPIPVPQITTAPVFL